MNHRIPSERSFGLSVGLVCAAAAALAWWRGHGSIAATLVTVAAILIVAALVAPVALRGLNHVWWRFAQALGWVNVRILLTVFFVFMLTPVGLVMRLCGRSPLSSSSAETNWASYATRLRNPRHYEHLF